MINVWNWIKKYKVASNKLSCKIKGISFSKDGNYFVTVGNRHVKFWYLTLSSLMETVPLKGRAAILNDMKNNNFCAVVCGHGECSHFTYALTTNGILCGFDENRSLSKVIELRTDNAYCLQADDYNLYIGCSQGTILIFNQLNLNFISSLPRPHNLGVDISKGLDTRHLIENLSNSELKYPDCIAMAYNSTDAYLTAIYNDHSLYVWDIKDVCKVKKIDSHLFHSSTCYSLDIYSNVNNYYLPQDSFITSSTDNTLRLWSLNNNSSSLSSSSSYGDYSFIKPTNIYSKELLHMIYIENDLSALCDTSLTSQDSNGNDNLPNASENLMLNVAQTQQSTAAQSNSNQNQLIKLGSRCLKICPTGRHLATGDRSGNLRIYDLKQFESIGLIEAHDSEILSLQYSQPESGRLLLASASRDRLIHIFDAKRNYDLIQTLDDHSAAITATRFCFNQIEKQFYVISCGYDKSIIFRSAQDLPATTTTTTTQSNLSNGTFLSGMHDSCDFDDRIIDHSNNNSNKIQFQRTSLIAEKQTFHDMLVDPTRNYINTVSADRIIRTYSIKDGKKLRQFKGSLSEDGYLLKMDMNQNGTLMATSCSDKCVYIWDLNTCECLAQLYGHSELIVDLKFTNDNQYLITISADSCIFVWKLSNIQNFMQTTQSFTEKTSSSRRSNVFSSNISLIPTGSRGFSDVLNSTEATVDDDLQPPQWAQKTLTSQQITTHIKNDNLRKSRAVWGPVCNTSFAIQVDNDLDESISSSKSSKDDLPNVIIHNPKATELSLPIQFPSPNIEKNLYQVVTLDTTLSKSLSKLSSEDSKDEDPLETPSTPTKENPFFTYLPKSNDENYASANESFGDAETKLFGHASILDSGGQQRRQSISTRYLQKNSQINSENSSPKIPISEEIKVNSSTESSSSSSNTISSPPPLPTSQPPTIKAYPSNMNAQLAAELLKMRKSVAKTVASINTTTATPVTNQSTFQALHSQHTESSLNKIKLKQNSTQQTTEKLNKSPSMVSLASGELSSNNSDETSQHHADTFVAKSLLNKSNSAKNSPTKQPPAVPIQAQHLASLNAQNLKKAASMMSLNQNPQCSLSSSSSFNSRQQVATSNGHRTSTNTTSGSQNSLPPKTVRQVKHKAQEKQNIIIVTQTNKTTSTTDSTRVRKLSNSIQNLQENNSPTKNTGESINRHGTIKTTRKKRSNTEEIIAPGDANRDELKPPPAPITHETKSPLKKLSNGYVTNVNNAKNNGFTTFNEHYQKVLSTFKTNIYALESIYSQVSNLHFKINVINIIK